MSASSVNPTRREPPDNRATSRALAILLTGLACLLAVSILAGRWRAGRVEWSRAPGHEMDFRIDLNRATELELLHLPGIGPKLARRIVLDRERRGPYQSLEDLGRVPGIGPALLARISPHLRWEGTED